MKHPNIFISYSRKDIGQAEKTQQRLKDAGFDVWRDVTDIEPGSNWSREVAQNLAERDIVVLLWSENAKKSEAVKHEWLTARALEKGIIPCLLESVEGKLAKERKLPPALEHTQGIFFEDFEKGIKELIDTLSNPGSIVREYEYTILPEKSNIPFRPNDNFVGRNRELLELYLTVIGGSDNVASGISQVVSLWGMGGIGKTQLAVEFAHRFGFAFSDGVFWLNAASDWKSEFATLAINVGISEEGLKSDERNDVLLNKLKGYISERRSLSSVTLRNPKFFRLSCSEQFVHTPTETSF